MTGNGPDSAGPALTASSGNEIGRESNIKPIRERLPLLLAAIPATIAIFRIVLLWRVRTVVNFDEAYVITLARQPFGSIWTEVTHGEANSFLHYFLSGVVVRVSPFSDLVALRLLSLLFMALSCPLIIKITQATGFTIRTGIFAAMLYFASPLTIIWSPAARYYSMYTFFVLLNLLFAIRFATNQRWVDAVLFTITGIAAISTCAIASVYVGLFLLAIGGSLWRRLLLVRSNLAKYSSLALAPAFAGAMAINMKLNDRGQVSWVEPFSMRTLLRFFDELMTDVGNSKRSSMHQYLGRTIVVAFTVTAFLWLISRAWTRKATGPSDGSVGLFVLAVGCAGPVIALCWISIAGLSFMSSRYLAPHSALLAIPLAAALIGIPGRAMLIVSIALLSSNYLLQSQPIGFVRGPLTSNLRRTLIAQSHDGDRLYLNPMLHTMLSFEVSEFGVERTGIPKPVSPSIPLGSISRWGKVEAPVRLWPEDVLQTARIWVVASRRSQVARDRDSFNWVTREQWFVAELAKLGFVRRESAPTDALIDDQYLELWTRRA